MRVKLFYKSLWLNSLLSEIYSAYHGTKIWHKVSLTHILPVVVAKSAKAAEYSGCNSAEG